jgi:CubicO group peptidase (beta-lactamase class C family)
MAADVASQLPKTLAAIKRGFETRLHIAAQLHVVVGGAIVADVALGEAQPGVPMRPDTLMPWLSAGKPITAVAIAQLWERGKLGLDDRIAQHIPEFAANGKEPITIRHILTHTAGFRAVLGEFENEPWERIIAAVCNAKLEPGWIIGQTAGYHPSTSWYILAELIQRIDGRPFEQYVREMILQPLGMNDTFFAMRSADQTSYAGRIARLHDAQLDHPPSAKLIDDVSSLQHVRPGSSARGPARDLAAFYEMLLRRGLAQNGARILSPQTVEAITARHRVGVYDKSFKHVMDWGLGFIAQSNQYGIDTLPYSYGPHASARTFGHGGSRSSIGYCDPERGLVVAAIFTRTRTEAEHHARMLEINAAIYEDLQLNETN